MVSGLLEPTWYISASTAIDFLTAATAFLLAMYAYKVHYLSKENRYKYLSAAFAVISASFLLKLGTNIFRYLLVLERHQTGLTNLSFGIIRSPALTYTLAGLAFRFMFVVGLLGILYIQKDLKTRSAAVLFVYFAAVVVLLSSIQYYVFFVTAVLVLALITFDFYKNHLEKQTKKTASLTLGFAMITLSQAGLIFSTLESLYPLLGLLQLLGFGLLLVTYMQLVRK